MVSLSSSIVLAESQNRPLSSTDSIHHPSLDYFSELFGSKLVTHLDTDFVGFFMSLLENEIHHLSDLVGSGHGSSCCLVGWIQERETIEKYGKVLSLSMAKENHCYRNGLRRFRVSASLADPAAGNLRD